MSGISTKKLSDAEHKRLEKLYPATFKMGQSFIKTDPGSFMFPAAYEKFKEEIYKVQIRPDDIYILTWPKTGTTWVQELTWLIVNDGRKSENASDVNTFKRVPFIEMCTLVDFLAIKPPGTTFPEICATLESMPIPRIIKSHLPYCLLPPGLLDKCKAVTVLRNPKDTVVSYYHHEKLLSTHGYTGTFAEYFDLFMDDLVICAPYWQYTLEAWQKRDHPNMCLMFYEDMKRDLEAAVRKVAKFVGKELKDEQVVHLVEVLTFKKMKVIGADREDIMRKAGVYTHPEDKDKSFFRKGEVGDWKNYFTEEMSKRMDDAIEKHFKGTGLEFRYE